MHLYRYLSEARIQSKLEKHKNRLRDRSLGGCFAIAVQIKKVLYYHLNMRCLWSKQSAGRIVSFKLDTPEPLN